MKQILLIEMPDTSAVSTQFESLTQTSIELPTLGDLSFQVPRLDFLTGVVESFTQVFQALPDSPDELVNAMLTELQGLSSGVLSMGDGIQQITAPISRIGIDLESFQPALNTITAALTQLSPQTIDSHHLSQLLPIDTLTNQLPKVSFNDLLTVGLDNISRLQVQADDLSIALMSQAYTDVIAALTELPLDALSADDINKANQQLDRLERAIATLSTQTTTALNTAESWTNNLDSFSIDLSTTLDTALTLLEPSQLGALATPLGDMLTAHPIPPNFTAVITQIESTLDAVNGLVDQGIDSVISGLDQGVATVKSAVVTVKQTLVKVSALVTNAIEQVIGFMQRLDLTGLVTQAKQVMSDVMAKINGVFDTVNGFIASVFEQITGLINQVDSFDMQSVVDALHGAIAQITAFLEHPQVADVIQQAKASIDTVVQQLEPITLTPVFDQVLAESDQVKASLQAIDVSQLNAVLRQALSVALTQLKDVLDPPTKVTTPIKEQYNIVTVEVLQKTVEPVKALVDETINHIYEFEPGTLVGNLLAAPFEAMVARVKEFASPDYLISLLQPIIVLQDKLLKQIEANLNPDIVFKPVVAMYEKLMAFVRSLSAEQLLNPLNNLLSQATGYLDQLNLENIVTTIVSSTQSITDWIGTLRLEDQAFWAPIESVINNGIRPVLATLIGKLKTTIQQLDFSRLNNLLTPVRDVIAPIRKQIKEQSLLNQVETVVTRLKAAASANDQQLATTTLGWQQQQQRLQAFNPLPALKADYTLLLERLQTLNPITALASVTSQLDRLAEIGARSLSGLQTLWNQLSDRLDQSLTVVENLTQEGADGLKAYLLAAVDALVAGPIENIVAWAIPLIAPLKTVVPKILSLQRVLEPLKKVPTALASIGASIIDLKESIQGINLSFLAEPLNRVGDELIKPLEAINPAATLVQPITQLFNRIVWRLQRLSPVNLLTAARGEVKLLATTSLTENLIIPAGTGLRATTPIGDIAFETTVAITLTPDNPTSQVTIQALTAGSSGDIVSDEGVSWSIAGDTLSNLKVTRSPAVSLAEHILSLTTLINKVLLAKLAMLHPTKLIAEPLNQQFQKVVDLIESLGLRQLFDALFEKLNRLSDEVEQGIDTMGTAFGGLVAAMPLTGGA